MASTQKYYKVLVNGKSFHGGEMQWSLPKSKRKGAWQEVKGEIVLCKTGLHLTSEPQKWWHKDAICYEVEIAPDAVKVSEINGDKIAVSKCRLVRAFDVSELAQFGIHYVSEGDHEFKSGLIYASGLARVKAYHSASVRASGSVSVTAYNSASVTAYNSASVKAHDSASVRASDSASVWVYGSASVKAHDSASVWAYGSASVRAYGSASVWAYGSASVWASDSASVWAYGSASVEAFDSAIIRINSGNPTVNVKGRAVAIDFRGDVNKVIQAE